MSLIKKLFGSKGEKFYLELEETATSVAGEAKKQIDKVTDSQPVQDATETATEVVQEAKKQVNSATTTKKPSGKKSQKTQQEERPATATNGASSWEPPFWVKAMYNNSSSNGKATNSEQTFATDNLMPTITTSRRRPGPSLNKFKDMASKAKTPKG
ncbi:MAG: hypothetical protein ACFCU5_19640 [Pleurocapsa sp.]